jgi:DNA-binding NtrC family response regulator
LRRAFALSPQPAVIVLGGGPAGLEAMRLGAFAVASRPLDAAAMLALIDRAVERAALIADRDRLRRRVYGEFALGIERPSSKRTQDLLDVIVSVAAARRDVLIVGEPGTGKGRIAQAIHQAGPGALGPLLRINCAALSRELLEVELFGDGRVVAPALRQARGAALLLDEVVALPADLQGRLAGALRARAGGDDPGAARVLATTNAAVDQVLRGGLLRGELHDLLAGVVIKAPPLRDRIEDLPALCEQFLRAFSERTHRPALGVDAEALQALMRHRWPGNIRELEQTLERAALSARGATITVEDLPALPPAREPEPEPIAAAGQTLAELEKAAIEHALKQTRGNKREAAQLLGIYRPTLYSKLKKHDIRVPRRRHDS